VPGNLLSSVGRNTEKQIPYPMLPASPTYNTWLYSTQLCFGKTNVDDHNKELRNWGVNIPSKHT